MALNEPVMILTYGESGWGKTVDLLYSFPRALFLGPPTAFVPGETVCGYRPAQVTNLTNLVEVIEYLKVHVLSGPRRFDAIVIDDLSLFTDNTFTFVEQVKKFSGFAFWGEIRRILMELRQLAWGAGAHVIMNAHVRGPHVDQKKGWVVGGPALPGTMPADMPKTFTSVFRVKPIDQTDSVALSACGWPFAYSCDPADDQYITKNRLGIYAPILPMNLGEILRLFFGVEESNPLAIRRHPKLGWQEEEVATLADAFEKLVPGSAEYDALKKDSLLKIMETRKCKKIHAAWTVRDAKARALLRPLIGNASERYI